MPYSKLNNPVFFALSETHQKFALHLGDTLFYQPKFAVFGGSENNNTAKAIEEYTKICDDFFIWGNKPQVSDNQEISSLLVCNQMILEKEISIEISEEIKQLQEESYGEIQIFMKKVYPHYFREKTTEMGRYFGIFKDKKLVAITGERMQMNDFTEVSAVVTDTDYLGKGLAKQLVAFTTKKIFEAGKTPFLHVAETNTGAIQLYEKLGFQTRCKMNLWNFKPTLQ